MKIISICQPHFLPWIGYFKLIKKSSKIIFLDDVQYNRRSWQNRVHIRNSSEGDKKKYLSLSVKNYKQSKKINEIYIFKENIVNFKNQMYSVYKNSKNFQSYFKLFSTILENNIDKDLAYINILYLKELCKILHIKLNYSLSSEYKSQYKKEFLILDLLKRENAKIYLSNVGSKNYVDSSFFEKKI